MADLRGYWSQLAARTGPAMADRADDEPVVAEATVWTVLGPPRRHRTVAVADARAAAALVATVVAAVTEGEGRGRHLRPE